MSRLFNDALSDTLWRNQAILSGVPLAIVCRFNTNDLTVNQALVHISDANASGGNDQHFTLTLIDNDEPTPNYLYAQTANYTADDIGTAFTTSGVSANTWHHGCAIFASSTDRRVLLDGGSKGTDTTDATPVNLDGIGIGVWRYSGGNMRFMSGMIAEVAIWDLSNWPGATGSDKADNFERILPGLAKGLTPDNYPLGLVAYWDLIRGLKDKFGGYNLSASGTIAAPHPRIIVPAPYQAKKHLTLIGLEGLVEGSSLLTTSLNTTKKLSTSIESESTFTSSLKVNKKLEATIEAQSSLTASLSTIKKLSTAIEAVSTLTSSVSVTKKLIAVIEAISILTASMEEASYLEAAITATSSLTASLSVIKKLIAEVSAQSIFTAKMRVGLVFPTLTAKFSIRNYTEQAEDPVLRSDPRQGAYLTRAPTKNTPIRVHLYCPVMGDTDKELLETWEKDKCGYGGRKFDMVSQINNSNYVTKLASPISYKLNPKSGGNLWEVDLDVKLIRKVGT